MTYPKDIINKVKSTTADTTTTKSSLMDSSKGTVTSALIGGGVGLAIGYYRKYDLLLSAIIGAFAAGLLSNFLINKSK